MVCSHNSHTDYDCTIFNLDKLSYASDSSSINYILENIRDEKDLRYQFLKVDLSNYSDITKVIEFANPDLVLTAVESHVDRSTDGPEVFIQSNVLGTFNLLEAVRKHLKNLKGTSKKKILDFFILVPMKFFGSLGKGTFNELTKYNL